MKIIFTLALLLTISNQLFADGGNIEKSETFKQKGKSGLATEILGVNSKYLYLLKESTKKSNALTLETYNKETLEKEKTLVLDNKRLIKTSGKEATNDFYLVMKVVTDEKLTLFFEYKNKKEKKFEVYAVSFSNELEKIVPFKKVFSYAYTKEKRRRKKDYQPSYGQLELLASEDLYGNIDNPNIAIVYEHPGKKGDEVVIDFKLFDAELNVLNSGKVPLEISRTEGGGSSADFFMQKNNDIAIINKVMSGTQDEVFSEEEDKKEKTPKSKKDKKKSSKKEDKSELPHYIVTIHTISVKDNKVTTTTLDLGKYNVHSLLQKSIGNNKLKFIGFFNDYAKSSKGYEMHGLFSGIYDLEKHEWLNQSFKDFDKGVINRIAEENNNIGKKTKKKDKEADKINDQIEISDFIAEGDGSGLLITQYLSNTIHVVTTTSTNSNGTTTTTRTTYYDSNRGNINLFKLSPLGDIEWVSVVKRSVYYSSTSPKFSWEIEDMASINNKGTVQITFENMREFEEVNTSKEKKKGKKEKRAERSFLDYANVNYKTGDVQVGKFDSKTAGLQIDASEVFVYDNQFYSLVTNAKVPFWYYPLACIPSLVCPPLYLVFIWPTIAPYKGDYTIARINLDKI